MCNCGICFEDGRHKPAAEFKRGGEKAKSAGVMNGIKQYKVRQRKGRPCLERFSAPVAQRA